MAQPSLSRRLLRKLGIDRVRRIVDHYHFSRARSAEIMIDEIVRRTGRDLVALVSPGGPFSIDEWNDIAYLLGGQGRRSFDAVRAEFEHRLDPIVAEFDVDERIVEVRDDPRAVQRLAQLLAMDASLLNERLRRTHGRTLLGRLLSEIRAERGTTSGAPEAEDTESDWEDEPLTKTEQEDAPNPFATLTRLLDGAFFSTTSGSSWPAIGTLAIAGRQYDVSIYARVIGGSSRGNVLERRFQNPSQRAPIVDDPGRHEILLGLWVEKGDEHGVIVAFDAQRRIGKTTRFSMFMPLSLLEQAADTGFATHETTSGELLYAFRPENIGRYVEAAYEAGQWVLKGSNVCGPELDPPASTQIPANESCEENSLNIRPRVGMYSAFARLNYKPWFALAEFVDNSIQSFLRKRDDLVALGHEGPLVIDINIDESEISVTDRAGGIAWADFPRAFSPAAPPDDTSGLSEFGLGMKAAACWFARRWSVRTSALCENVERTVVFDIPRISRESSETLPIESRSARESDHFTVVTMNDLRVRPRGRTLTKIKDHLASIYRVLLGDGTVRIRLTTNGKTDELAYAQPELLHASYYRNRTAAPLLWRGEFEVDLHDRKVSGWAGIMARGSHAGAGFSVFRRRRLIEGSIGETYKPHLIFGNPNSFASQRVVGEMFVEGFDVSHTKDGIQWHGYEDEVLESIRRQLDSHEFPMLDQAEGYRVRKMAEALPAGFGAEALADTAAALTNAIAIESLRVQVEQPLPADFPSADMVHAEDAIIQMREFKLQVVRDGKPWKVHIVLVRDGAAPFYSTAVSVAEGEEVVTVQINLSHEFSVAFINDNEAALQPLMRFIAALALGERVARLSGVRNPGAVRQQANTLLRALASEEIQYGS